MIDLFNFLKNLLHDGIEVIAAFLMGAIVAAAFLTYVIYWVMSGLYGKKAEVIEDAARKHKENLAEAEKKLAQKEAEIARKEQRVGHLEQKSQAEEGKVAALAKEFDLFKRKAVTVATSYKRQVLSLNAQMKELERLESHLWDLPVDKSKLSPFRPLKKNSAVIMAVINLKGGVGKTTITANVAATLCRQQNQRVLVVDLDFQASLTGLCLSADFFDERKLGVDEILKSPFAEVAKIGFESTVRTHEPKMRLLSSSEYLPNLEERAKATWLLNPGPADLRCVFRRMLHDPLFQGEYDVILIDCPPRWTTTSINAIACCDYILIPTTMDRVSAEAVPRLLKWLRNLKSASADLYGGFHVLGVLGNRANPRAVLIEQERKLWEGLPEKCKAAWGAPVHHFGTIIREKGEIHRAADHREFAALDPALQPTFVQLIQEMDARRSEHESR